MPSSVDLAYVFERFPTFTQTFCVREILELERQGFRPVIFSIRDTSGESIQHYPPSLRDRVITLPDGPELTSQVWEWIETRSVPKRAVGILRGWGNRHDRNRLKEAIWIGETLKRKAPTVKHLHTHFAGIGARVLWWLHHLYGYTYSLTGHANDLFCPSETSVIPMKQLLGDAKRIITVSGATVEWIETNYPQTRGRVRKVYNGLDLSLFQQAKPASENPKVKGQILSVGRLIEKKGFADLIRACAHLKARGVDFHCHIVGDGPLEEALQDLIFKSGLQNHVTLTGPLSQERIIEMLARETEVFALLCATESDGGKDNLPTVLMEAMASSLPCVSTRLAGVPEMVEDRVTGLLCEEGQPEEAANLLQEILSQPERARQMGLEGLQRAKARFALEVTVRELRRVFEEMNTLNRNSFFKSTFSWSKRWVMSFLTPWIQRLQRRTQTVDVLEFVRSRNRES